MKKSAFLNLCLLVCLSIFILLPASAAFCQDSAHLKEGIAQYKQENYEEAIVALQKAREEDHKSSVAAFYLVSRQTSSVG